MRAASVASARFSRPVCSLPATLTIEDGRANAGSCRITTTLERSAPSVQGFLPSAPDREFTGGAFLVITDPAPMVASGPTATGATSDALEPMKAPSPIVVVDLFTPS